MRLRNWYALFALSGFAGMAVAVVLGVLLLPTGGWGFLGGIALGSTLPAGAMHIFAYRCPPPDGAA